MKPRTLIVLAAGALPALAASHAFAGVTVGVRIGAPAVVVPAAPVVARAPVVVPVAPVVAAPAVVVARPVYAAPAPHRVWVPGHWAGGVWVGAHWS